MALLKNNLPQVYSFHQCRIVQVSSRRLPEGEVLKYPSLVPLKEYCEITFKDNGIGFEQKYGAQIFAIFQRLHSQEAYKGTGIGLALCKKIAENHSGKFL